jgi:hypothetical protein
MNKVSLLRVFVVAASLLALGMCLCWCVYRPWAINWGAADLEVARAMPGDGIIANATFSATRAITVFAEPEDIWPWLVQLGYRRAGLYSYDFLDNDGIPSAEQILPEYQDLQVGDSLPIGPGFYVSVEVLEPFRQLLLVFPEWAEATWAWGLYPDGPNRTRLVTRLRGRPLGFTRIFVDLTEIFPMRKSMLGIKRRAERLARQRTAVEGTAPHMKSCGLALHAGASTIGFEAALRCVLDVSSSLLTSLCQHCTWRDTL